MKVLVTGASGFIGAALVRRLASEEEYAVRASYRRSGAPDSLVTDAVVVGDIDSHTDWSAALEGCTSVVHTAARVHVMRDRALDPLAEFRRVNVDGSLNLARQAALKGARRFLFISSIKVNGAETRPDRPFTAEDTPAPEDAYGVSKLEAEQGLRELAADSGMELVIIRPVLVYGPGVRANFRAMLRAIDRGVPLPFGSIQNRRSLVAIDNLVDILVRALSHPRAPGRIFLASDGEDLSTADLLRRVACAMSRRALLFPMPVTLLEGIGALTGKRSFVRRLCGSLIVDITSTRQVLEWTPLVSVDDALRSTVSSFLRER